MGLVFMYTLHCCYERYNVAQHAGVQYIVSSSMKAIM